MEGQPRCIKCGRILKSAASIARGMGSKCAGITIATRRIFHRKYKRNSGRTYRAVGTGGTEVTLFLGDLSTKRSSKREVIHKVRDERRRLFQERKPFQCGFLTRTHTPVVYIPTGDNAWKENHSGRIIPHDILQSYLKRFSLI